MKILASVYACSPFDGSERAVGWNWLCELNQYHEVTALTSHVYKNDIENYLRKHPNEMRNIEFIYIEVPNSKWHVGYRLERLYYILWQKQAVQIAKNLVTEKQYDLVHHITYVTCILPTEMYKLGIPFLYGPVSGGENTPKIIRYPIGMKDRVIETVRSVVQRFFCMTPNFYRTMEGANIILATTEETRDLVPDKYKEKTFIFQSIGLQRDTFFPVPEEKPDRIPRFLMAGRMLYWKGFQLGIKAFIAALESGFVGELVVLGDTECNHSYKKNKEILQTLCGKYLNTNIKFVEKVEYSKMKAFYDGFDVLINCNRLSES